MDALALLYFSKISWLYVRTIGVCGYGYIYGYIYEYMDIHGYIHGYPRKICGYGYGYGWQISYPRQACQY